MSYGVASQYFLINNNGNNQTISLLPLQSTSTIGNNTVPFLGLYGNTAFLEPESTQGGYLNVISTVSATNQQLQGVIYVGPYNASRPSGATISDIYIAGGGATGGGEGSSFISPEIAFGAGFNGTATQNNAGNSGNLIFNSGGIGYTSTTGAGGSGGTSGSIISSGGGSGGNGTTQGGSGGVDLSLNSSGGGSGGNASDGNGGLGGSGVSIYFGPGGNGGTGTTGGGNGGEGVNITFSGGGVGGNATSGTGGQGGSGVNITLGGGGNGGTGTTNGRGGPGAILTVSGGGNAGGNGSLISNGGQIFIGPDGNGTGTHVSITGSLLHLQANNYGGTVRLDSGTLSGGYIAVGNSHTVSSSMSIGDGGTSSGDILFTSGPNGTAGSYINMVQSTTGTTYTGSATLYLGPNSLDAPSTTTNGDILITSSQNSTYSGSAANITFGAGFAGTSTNINGGNAATITINSAGTAYAGGNGGVGSIVSLGGGGSSATANGAGASIILGSDGNGIGTAGTGSLITMDASKSGATINMNSGTSTGATLTVGASSSVTNTITVGSSSSGGVSLISDGSTGSTLNMYGNSGGIATVNVGSSSSGGILVQSNNAGSSGGSTLTMFGDSTSQIATFIMGIPKTDSGGFILTTNNVSGSALNVFGGSTGSGTINVYGNSSTNVNGINIINNNTSANVTSGITLTGTNASSLVASSTITGGLDLNLTPALGGNVNIEGPTNIYDTVTVLAYNKASYDASSGTITSSAVNFVTSNFVTIGTIGATVSSVTDNNSNTYTLISSVENATGINYTYLYVATGIPANQVNTITVNLSTSNPLNIMLDQIYGNPSNIVPVTGTGNSGSISLSITTTAPGQTIFMCGCIADNVTVTGTSTATVIDQLQSSSGIGLTTFDSEYTPTAPGTYNTAVTLSSSFYWAAIAVVIIPNGSLTVSGDITVDGTLNTTTLVLPNYTMGTQIGSAPNETATVNIFSYTLQMTNGNAYFFNVQYVANGGLNNTNQYFTSSAGYYVNITATPQIVPMSTPPTITVLGTGGGLLSNFAWSVSGNSVVITASTNSGQASFWTVSYQVTQISI
ncbi:MAG: beta strand repeat-containing protein [Nitrososphaerales archaeon]